MGVQEVNKRNIEQKYNDQVKLENEEGNNQNIVDETINKKVNGSVQLQADVSGQTSDSEESGLKQRIKSYIGNYMQAPGFIKDNIYIRSGYRINFGSAKSMFKSLFMIHNEIVNIWSHFIGAILVIIFGIYLTTSFGNIDFMTWKQKLASNVTEKFQPIYDEFKAFDEVLNKKVYEGYEIIKQDFNIIENNVVENFNSLLNELNNIKKEITPQNIDKIVQKFNEFSIQEYYQYADLKKLQAVQEDVIQGINNLKNDLIRQIDSREFDWIDFHMSDFMHSQDTQTSSNHYVSRWPIFVFMITAFLCLLCSAAFHLFHAINPQYYKIFLRIDYAGVSLLISGSTFPIFYYGFFCQIQLAYFYLISIGIASLVVFFVSLQDFIHTPKYFTMKSVMYASLGFFAAIPLIHLVYFELFNVNAIGNFSMGNSLIYYIFMGVCYLGGLTIYATRCPERYKPGQFDICGASHQLWHISILLAIVLTYIGSLINFYTRKMNLCPVN